MGVVSILDHSLLGRIVRWLLSRTSPCIGKATRRRLHRRHLLVTVQGEDSLLVSLADQFLLLSCLFLLILLLHDHDIWLLLHNHCLILISLKYALERICIICRRIFLFLASEPLIILRLLNTLPLRRGSIVFFGRSRASTIETIPFTLDSSSLIIKRRGGLLFDFFTIRYGFGFDLSIAEFEHLIKAFARFHGFHLYVRFIASEEVSV